MRLFIGSLMFVGFLASAFVVGIASQQTLLMMGAFCLWTPAVAVTGYALAHSGIRIYVGREQNQPAPRVNRPKLAAVERDF